jgi:protein-S-isoprenylcysteine O-methyltransferase Ste14
MQKQMTWARALGLFYGASAFLGTWVFFTWFVIFLGNLPKRHEPWISPTVDVAAGTELTPLAAALANAALLSLFCLQHSLMARPRFKRALAAHLPPALERATYVHAANLTGFLFLALWTPIDGTLWSIENDAVKAVIWMAFGTGWLILFLAALSIDVTELLGLRQAWRWSHGLPHAPLALKTSWLYRYLEHPMYVGVLLGFWMTPHMTVGHALLASQLTLYIALAMSYERRDLTERFGAAYLRWRDRGAPAGLPSSASMRIAAELQRRLEPVVLEPLPRRMVVLLNRI